MISAQIIADSLAPHGARLTTFSLTYPRFIHCFDDKTEVLAIKEGSEKPSFILFKDLVGTKSLVAQISQDFKIEYVNPLAWIENHFTGKLLQFSNQRLDFCVTDEHRLFVGSRKNGYDKKEIILAKDLIGDHTQKRFFKKGQLLKTKSYGKDFCKFLAFFLSDGHCPKNGKQALFRFKKEIKINCVENLLRSLGKEYKKIKYEDGVVSFAITRESWMDQCYTQDRKKCVPSQFFDMDSEDFLAFEEGLLESDGNVKNREFNTFSEPLINDLQVIFHTHKRSFNIRKYGDCYKVKFQIEDEPILRKDKHKIIEVEYDGKVYCCTVPTGLLLVRRNGIVHISGNCEFMTHRVFSRNASSSRAVPVRKMLDHIRNNPSMPVWWGKNQPGMQAKEEMDPFSKERAKEKWLEACRDAVRHAQDMMEMGVHKQIANRLIEPFAHINTIVTATEWDNFYNLRCHPDAQPEIQALATIMKKQFQDSNPRSLFWEEWHLPYISNAELGDATITVDSLIKYCVARCCRVSYMNHDGTNPDPAKDLDLHDKLLASGHLSPFEHAAKPALKRDEWHGNFRGWIQYRKLIPGESVFKGLSS